MKVFLSGAIMMGYTVLALFFIRFWIRTHDRFFAFFALAFLMLSLERWLLLGFGSDDESRSLVFLMRLAAFIVIIFSVIMKNREPRRRP